MMRKGADEKRLISGWIKEESSLLDLGCGTGQFLSSLISEKNVRAQGIEINEEAVQRCLALGLSVIQQDIDVGLSEYGDKSFDYVVLNQTFQQVKKPDFVLKEALRVGNRVIVGFPNFCYVTDRFQIFFRGRVPVTRSLPYEWYDTPNIHFLTISDFELFCRSRNIAIERFIGLQSCATGKTVKRFGNLRSQVGIFVITSRENLTDA